MMRQTYYSLCNLAGLTIEEIEARIMELDPEISFLDLSSKGDLTSKEVLPGNNLGNRISFHLLRILDAIKKRLPKLSSMNLADNNLGCLTKFEVENFFSNLPKLKYLDLSNNNLGNYDIDKWEFVIAYSQELDHLDLGNNGLFGVKGLELIFKNDHKGPRYLGLSANNLGVLSGKRIKNFFSSIPQDVEILDLRDNRFLSIPLTHCVNFTDLINAINHLTKNIRFLDLRERYNENLGRKISSQICLLPENIKIIGLNSSIHEVYRLWADPIIEKVHQKIVHNVNGKCAFEEIFLTMEIDERILNCYIANLEKCKHELSSLICGLLLQGKIPNILPECDNERAYVEKRLHDAITYYTKAAQDKILRPIVLDILWQIKTTSTIPSIKNRLTQYDLSDVMNYKKFPLANRSRLFSVHRNLCQQMVLASPQNGSDKTAAIGLPFGR